MRIKISKKLSEMGAALLVALVVGSILCVSILGYLRVAEQQHFLSMRSQSWNMAITVVEAGVEEGLQHLNAYPTNPGADGWTLDPTGVWYSHRTTLPGDDSYTVSVTVTNIRQPLVICKAELNSPVLFTSARSPFMFAAAGVTVAPTTAPTVTRAVQVKTSRGMLFNKAMVARNTIDMKGNNILTDSYDSDSLFYSNYGKYDPNHPRDNGDVASNDTMINVGNANIYGHVQTGPNGTITVGSQGGIGSHTWQASNHGIEANSSGDIWTSHDSNFTFPETPLPSTTGALPMGGSGDIATTTYNINSNYVGSSSTYPNPAPWSGVSTNLQYATSMSYPSPGTYISGTVTTNTTRITDSTSYPSAGTYVGSVSTNYQTQQISNGSLPAPGTYVPGSLVSRPNNKWDYQKIIGYLYSYYQFNYYLYVSNYTYNFANYTTNAVTVTNHYDHVLYSGSYVYTGSSLGSVIVLGGATLILPNGLSMSSGDQITIANNGGASLIVYAGGTSGSVSGNGVINQAGNAANFIVFFAPTVTSVNFNGNGQFTGILVAPNAAVSMNGGGSADEDFSGALMAGSINMNGHFKFHYDEALGRKPLFGRLLITQWDEIDPKVAPAQ